MSTFFVVLSVLAIIALIIGLISPKIVVFWSKSKTRKGVLVYLAAFIVFAIIGGATSGGGTAKATSSQTKPTSTNTQSKVSKPVKPKAPSTIQVDKTLDSGNYKIGTDLPAGTYNFKAVKGGGNVTSDDGTINEIMGTADKGSTYTPTFSNANLRKGETLSLSGVSLQVTSSNASGSPLTPRNQTVSKIYTFKDGNYTVGKDINVGVYNLAAVSGGGNVTSEDGEINLIMGTDNDDTYVKNFANADLKSGMVLKISGVTITLTPSK